MNNVGESFYKSISDSVINLSKTTVRHFNAAEKCIEYFKYLKEPKKAKTFSHEIIEIDDEQEINPISSINYDENRICASNPYMQCAAPLNHSNFDTQKSNVSCPNYFLMISTNLMDLNEKDFQKLSDDIKECFVCHDFNEQGQYLNR